MEVTQKAKKRDTRPQVTYKGIEKETQAAVRKAAKKANSNIGVWVNKVLLEAAKNELQKEKKKTLPPVDISKELTLQREALEKLAGKVETLVNKPGILERLGFK